VGPDKSVGREQARSEADEERQAAAALAATASRGAAIATSPPSPDVAALPAARRAAPRAVGCPVVREARLAELRLQALAAEPQVGAE